MSLKTQRFDQSYWSSSGCSKVIKMADRFLTFYLVTAQTRRVNVVKMRGKCRPIKYLYVL